MKIISIFRHNFDPAQAQAPPSPELMEQMGALIGEMMAAGKLVNTGGVVPNGVATRVRHNGNGSFNVTDGPFTETKEVVGGFAVFDVESKEEAVQWTERFLSIAGPGVCELIEVSGPDE